MAAKNTLIAAALFAVVLALATAPAAAEPMLVNGDFEDWGAYQPPEAWWSHAVVGWTSLGDLFRDASGVSDYGVGHITADGRFLMVWASAGQVGRTGQDLGVMTPGEQYILSAEVYAGQNSGNTYQVQASFVSALTANAPALGGGAATQIVNINTTGGKGAFDLRYTATEADAGNHLVLRIDGVVPSGAGGIDNARLLVVTEGNKVNIAGTGNIGTRQETGRHIDTEYVYRQGAEITVNGISTGVVYAGTQDTYIHNGDSDTASHGSQGSFSIDPSCTGQSGDQAQGLLRFDNVFGSGPGQVPVAAPVRRAYVELSQTDGIGYAAFRPNAYKMLGPWDQATVNWNNLKLNGNTQGGIQMDGMEASADFTWWIPAGGNNCYARYTIDITTDVQYFANHPELNFGWGLPPIAVGGWLGMDLISSEGSESERPTLRVRVDMNQALTTLLDDRRYVFELTDLLNFDQLRAFELGVAGEAIIDLNGAELEVTLFGATAPAPGAYRLLLADTLVGNFSNIILPDIAGVTWDTSGLAAGGDGYLRVIPEPATICLLAMGGLAALIRRQRV